MGGVVPLSEHEQRQLEQIEQALYREDRRLARLVRSSDPRVHYRRRVASAVSGLAVGAGMVAVGLVLHNLMFLAVAGFAVMLLCGIWALTSWRHMAGGTAGQGGEAAAGTRRSGRSRRRKQRASRQGGIMERFEERWRRRQEGGR
jgi:hypothetical protein